ncbi:MAG TPA: hypothetical protein HA340_01570 [Candidatus Thalassarchaeaceae archaeon]|jgi:chromosome segregation ATPase|nr:hypothetical protein [Euryarchaeota archaeon]MDP6378647.1 hypothetical protein [Candidatus Thalassarchaeaceae archaeon]DAC51607.1 MAG TPA: hypothetical protein D7H97_01540 [Candidatus Poseidoniales archaeon]HIH82614.1 hypothetical protein [Candidatus Thalassarchaeaceae archaeon]|tara:strand:+ start:2243 stop:3256 length:1014 start_codon:yes stop_codon:yes gene_type:complete
MSNARKKGKSGKKGRKGRSDKDFFEDLRGLETHQLEERLNDNKSSARAIESQLDSMESERSSLISTVQVLRTALGQSGKMSKERHSLLTELRARTPQINEAKAIRDDINERVGPPSNVIEKLLKRTWRDLTTIREDASRAPQLAQEIQKFSFFFELIEMHKLKQQSDAAHKKFVDLIRAQKETIKKLDELKDGGSEIAEQASEESPRLSGISINRKEERNLNKRIEKMLESIRANRKELKYLKREMGRLESFIRIRKGDEQRGIKVRMRINSLREHAVSGGSLSVEDMARLLKSGGLSQLQQTSEGPQPKKKKERRGGRKKSQARRGVARSFKRRED